MFRNKAKRSSLSNTLSHAIESMRSLIQIKSTIGPDDEMEYKEALGRASTLQKERNNIAAWEEASDNLDLGPEVRAEYTKAYQRNEPNKREMKENQKNIERFESKFKKMNQATQNHKRAITQLTKESKSHLKTADITDELYKEIQACITEFNKPSEMTTDQLIETNLLKLQSICKKMIRLDDSMGTENPGPNAPH